MPDSQRPTEFKLMVNCLNPKSTRIRLNGATSMDKTGAGLTKQKSRLKITHAQNDARYVEMRKLLPSDEGSQLGRRA